MARRAVAARQHTIDHARRDSAQHAQALNAQIDAERQLAAAHLQPVFDPDRDHGYDLTPQLAAAGQPRSGAQPSEVAEAIRLADVGQPQSPTQAVSDVPAHGAALALSGAPARAVKRARR